MACAVTIAVAGCGVLPEPPPADAGPPRASAPAAPSAEPGAPSTGSTAGFSRIERAAVRVRNVGCELSLSTGSGFAIDEHTLVTNRHVVEGAQQLQLDTYDGHELTVSTSRAVYLADLAVVTTPQVLPDSLPLAARNPEVGQPVTVVGYPRGGPRTTTRGQVTGYTADPLDATLGQVIMSDAPIEPGSSGSAMTNAAGEVVAVVYAADFNAGIYLAVPVETLAEALSSGRGEPATRPC